VVGRNANAVAEFTLGLIIGEMRNIARADGAMRDGLWYNRVVEPERCFELTGKTIGLVGFGAIAQRLAELLAGFGMRILAYDPFVPAETFAALNAESVAIDAVFAESDVVSIHARLLPETEGLVGARELGLMKPSAYLINTARAGLVDEGALLGALQEKRIAGAAIDVFWREPLPTDSPWLELDNLTVTSHLAGTTIDSLYYSVELVVQAVLDYLREGKTELVINPEVFANG
jgi:D-3-phosphoglycerate dehydrogenase